LAALRGDSPRSGASCRRPRPLTNAAAIRQRTLTKTITTYTAQALPHPAPEADDPARTQLLHHAGHALAQTQRTGQHRDCSGRNRTATRQQGQPQQARTSEPDTTNSDAAGGGGRGSRHAAMLPGAGAQRRAAGVPPCCAVPGSASTRKQCPAVLASGVCSQLLSQQLVMLSAKGLASGGCSAHGSVSTALHGVGRACCTLSGHRITGFRSRCGAACTSITM
jgi:hypothetical protein